MQEEREEENECKIGADALQCSAECHLGCSFRFSGELCDFAEGIIIPEPEEDDFALFGREFLKDVSRFSHFQCGVRVTDDVRVIRKIPDVFNILCWPHLSEVIDHEVACDAIEPGAHCAAGGIKGVDFLESMDED